MEDELKGAITAGEAIEILKKMDPNKKLVYIEFETGGKCPVRSIYEESDTVVFDEENSFQHKEDE